MNESIRASFSQADIEAFRPTMKIGLLATINDQGLPHLTLLASLQASSPTQVIFGQFTEGLSKRQVQDHPQAGFLIMTLDKELWRGRARFSHTTQDGPDFDRYNNTPMFRYNAYFGVHTVYYLDLVEQSGRQVLPMNRVILAAIKTIAARLLAGPRAQEPVLNLWTRQLMNKLDNLKFLAYVREDGYPSIIPLIQAQAADAQHIVYSTSAYQDELEAIPRGAPVAVFGMSLQMEDVLMRGVYQGIGRVGGFRCGRVSVDWVYSPMPPKPQQIYPRIEVKAISAEEFRA